MEHKEVEVPEVQKPRKRPLFTHGITLKIETGCGSVFVTINEDDIGICEVFSQLGKAGGCPSSQLEALARIISLALKSNTDVKLIIKNLRGIRCPNPTRIKEGVITSCADALGVALETYISKIKKILDKGDCSNIRTLKIGAANADDFEEQIRKQKKQMKEEDDKDINKVSITTNNTSKIAACPECGGSVNFVEGCNVCPSCGWSACS